MSHETQADTPRPGAGVRDEGFLGAILDSMLDPSP
jgi:hypothetical protein